MRFGGNIWFYLGRRRSFWFTQSQSGHINFTIKDDKSQIRVVYFRKGGIEDDFMFLLIVFVINVMMAAVGVFFQSLFLFFVVLYARNFLSAA